MEAIVVTQNLSKKYRGNILAVDRVSFEVNKGEIFGFLGPNGAGKSTTIHMLTTMIRPTGGKAQVCRFDVAREPWRVRKHIGFVSQDIAVDETLTGRENLSLQGRFYHLTADVIAQRTQELLTMVDLADRADSLVSTYSGGMRKRLDIAEGLIHRPSVLFLDEPTLGLDIQTRHRIWDYVEQLREEHQITIFLTTHYMDEADSLCDRIAIIDHGQIVALLSLVFAGLSLALGAVLTSHEALIAVTNFFTMPLMFTSNAMMPLEMMPDWLGRLARWNPLTYAINPMRELFLTGWNTVSILQGVVVLLVAATLATAIATSLFQRNLA